MDMWKEAIHAKNKWLEDPKNKKYIKDGWLNKNNSIID